jgi:hypothetical protein
MEEFKGTKGPWEIVEHSWSDTSLVFGNKTICTNSIYDEATEETQDELESEVSANFNLMSASLDMLEALQKVYRLAKKIGLEEDLDFEEFDYMGAAINKALGR